MCERRLIEQALEQSNGRVFGPAGAATRLGVPSSTLESKIRRLRINKHQYRPSEPQVARRSSTSL
jgi:formate hydrogenlyase transcriptional activator